MPSPTPRTYSPASSDPPASDGRRILFVSCLGALGGVAGGLLVPPLFPIMKDWFEGYPVWALPASLAGLMAVTTLFFPLLIRLLRRRDDA